MSESAEVKHSRIVQDPRFIFNNEAAFFRCFLRSEITTIALSDEIITRAQDFLDRIVHEAKAPNANLPRLTKQLKDERAHLTQIRNQNIAFNKKFSEYIQTIEPSILKEVGGLCLFLAAAFAAVVTMPMSVTAFGICSGLSLFGLYHFIGGYWDRVTIQEAKRLNL
jgi:hypothetical protein